MIITFRINSHTTLTPSRLRRRNDQQMLLERIFLLPQGLPGQVSYRHALFSPAKHNSYGTVL